MSNVLQITDQMSNVMNSVHLEDIYTKSGKQINDRRVVVDTASDAPISVVSNRYKLITNEEAFTSVARAIDISKLNTDNIIVNARNDEGGRRTLVNFIFPEHQIVLNQDVTNLRLIAKNSYDGSWKVETLAGAFRIACANNQVFSDYLKVFSAHHFANSNQTIVNGRIDLALNVFKTEGRSWINMSKSKVSEQKALNFICRFFAKNEMTIKSLANMKAGNRLQHAMNVFNHYSTEMGQNLWALYNTMTKISTFNQKGEKNVSTMQNFRESQVRKVISSDLWKKSLALAV